MRKKYGEMGRQRGEVWEKWGGKWRLDKKRYLDICKDTKIYLMCMDALILPYNLSIHLSTVYCILTIHILKLYAYINIKQREILWGRIKASSWCAMNGFYNKCSHYVDSKHRHTEWLSIFADSYHYPSLHPPFGGDPLYRSWPIIQSHPCSLHPSLSLFGVSTL